MALTFKLNRESAFSFACRACGVCCRNKIIRVAPYEALRLARNLGLATTEFYRTFTSEGGGVLREKPDGTCVFLDDKSCRVHQDRPLVCRLFPLGQIVDKQGRELFGAVPLDPDCIGLRGVDATVASYLESQAAEPYFRYERAYSVVFKKMLKTLVRSQPLKSKRAAAREVHPGDTAQAPGTLLSAWLDIDGTVDGYCRKNGHKKPGTLEETVRVHLRAIEEWLEALQAGARGAASFSRTRKGPSRQ